LKELNDEELLKFLKFLARKNHKQIDLDSFKV